MKNCDCKLVNGKSCKHGYRLNTPNVKLITEALRHNQYASLSTTSQTPQTNPLGAR